MKSIRRVKLEMRQLLLQTSHKERLEVGCCECRCRYLQMRWIRGLAFRYYWPGRLEGTTGLRGSQFDAKEDIKICGDHCDHKLAISPPLLPLIPKCRPQWYVQSIFSTAHFRDVTMAMQGTGAIHVTIYLAGGTLVISIVSHLPLYEVPVAQFCRANQPSTQVSRSLVSKRYVMKKTLSDLPDSALYTKQNICDNTLDDAQLETRCPLDNGRHADALMSTHYPAGQLDQLPAELLIQILLQIDIPSLTHFRRVNRRAMGLVDSIPQMQQREAISARQLLQSANPPSVLSLPGRLILSAAFRHGRSQAKEYQRQASRVSRRRPSIEVETTAYQWINDSRIGPKFFGHLTEAKDGRVIGFAVEWLQGARAAGPGDIESCKKTLARLHQLGIKSGDVNKHNFLVRDGHDVVLVDFETARRNCSSQELEDEMSALENSLEDRSLRGGVESVHGQ
ncbi:hypothetical protein HYQ46_008930 [Verticillium longisporum]|nr:hypothetical protein HYQ46_008930 [Verticillium longisporum]